jgi:hypothetical protein
MKCKEQRFAKWSITHLMVLSLSLIVLYGCGVSIVYQDKFESMPIGQPPGPPEIGTSSVDGDVRIAESPVNDVSPDHWLQLKRVSPVRTHAVYVATLKEPVTEGGSVALVGYIPKFAPITMSVYFETPNFPEPSRRLLHIDLSNGKILVNDSIAEGTYKLNTTIAFVIGFDLDASPPTASIHIRGGAQDANATVEIPAVAAGRGLGHVRIETPFESVNSLPGRFFINEVVVIK